LLNRKTVPHENVDFALVKSSFGMQHADSGGLSNCLGRRSAGTSGCHGYIVIAENWIGNLSMVLSDRSECRRRENVGFVSVKLSF
jgi:hypothetical protein